MRPIQHAVAITAVCLAILAAAGTANAVYFTMQLKNGNEIITDKYTGDNSSSILFYTNEGTVVIPRSLVRSIRASDGTVTVESEEPEPGAADAYFGEGEDTAGAGVPGMESEGQKLERLNSIKDQLAVINANLDNLSRNRSIFLSQKEQYEQQRQKSEERLAGLKKREAEGFNDTNEAIDLEQSRMKDIESRLADISQRIENNEKMSDAQQRMKERIEVDMAAQKK